MGASFCGQNRRGYKAQCAYQINSSTAHLHSVTSLYAHGVRCSLEGKLRNQPMTFFTTSRSFCGSNGFTSQPVAPAALPWALMASPDSVVSIKIGTLV